MNKILFCCPYEISAGNNAGGIVIWTRNIVSQYLSKKDYRIQLELLSTSRKIYISEHSSKFKRFFSGIIEYASIINKIKKRITQHNDIDGLHITSSGSMGLIRDYIILKYATKRNIKTFIHFHFGRIPSIIEKKGKEYKRLLRVCKIAHRVIVMDSKSLVALKREGIENAIFLPNPVSNEVFEVLQTQYEVKRQPRRILFVGHVVKGKGIFELIEACSQIQNIELLVIGKVDKSVQDWIDTQWHDAEWLKLLGTMPHKDVIVEMLKCGIFILPSYSEGFPNVILEAMACSCPIIASSVGAIPEMLGNDTENKCGLVIPPKNLQAIKNAILTLLSDENLTKEIANNAVLKVNSEYTPEKVFKHLCDIWCE